MTEENLAVAKIIKQVVSEDKGLLTNYEAFLGRIKADGVSGGDYRAINNAMQYRIADVLNLVSLDSVESIQEGRRQMQTVLRANNMLQNRIDFIVEVFDYAMGWQEAEDKLLYQQEIAVAGSEPPGAESNVVQQNKAAEHDSYAPPAENADDIWICPSCHEENTMFFCENCGSKRPEPVMANSSWLCTSCGRSNIGRFCTGCGIAKPVNAPSIWYCSCGKENIGRFCTACGSPRQ